MPAPGLLAVWLLLLVLVGVACGGSLDGQASPEEAMPPEGEEAVRPTSIPTQPLPTQPPAVPEPRLLTLEWPARLRTGDSDVIRLTLEVDEEGNITPTASYEGNEIITELVLIPNVYDTHNVLAEARLDIAGLEVIPPDLFSQALRPGETVTFSWSVRAADVGRYRGTVWLFLRFLPLDGSADSQVALSAQVIEIQAVNLLGIGGTTARLMGLVGVAASGLLGADDILKALGWLFKRLYRRK
jgi:hypothetical protein